MVIRLTLLLIPTAIANFLLAIVLEQFSMTALATQVSQLGSIVLLSAFFLFLCTGLAHLSKLAIITFYGYFSPTRRMERNLLFHISKYNRLTRLFHFKKARLLYMNQQQRKRLLKKVDWKAISS